MAFLAIENTASSSSIPAPPSDEYTYDVFLSFRGTDTRDKFTDHLYDRLKQKGIFTFRDYERLERGTSIAQELVRAIKESRIAVVILSSDYASSRWCLAELAMILECMEMKKLRVLPVFHYVDPSDVRNQRSTFGEAFEKHNERCKDNTEDLQRWRAALTKVAGLAGWTLHSNKPESKVIEDIVKKIEVELKSTYSFDYKDLVGINCRLKKLENLLDMVSDEVHLIGIWGTGGMGKTTLAQVVYDRFHYEFQGSSFLANVREESGSGKDGIVNLQKQLLSDILIETNFDFPNFRWGSNVIKKRLCHKKVLVILDDVDKLDQLEALAGEQSWFGGGSRIIITTRNQRMLISHKVPEAQMYKVEEMNNDEALELFSRKAFEKDHPLEGYEEFSQKFIYYAGGLPLALKVLGSSLLHLSLNLWESSLTRCKDYPPRDILDVLQISVDGLEEREKNIFLDIACFYRNGHRDYVTNILQILYDKPDVDIDVLSKKSLIDISKGYFRMHELLQELGRNIVRRENLEEAGCRSRLWHDEDIFHVLKENTGTKSVKSIFHPNLGGYPRIWNSEDIDSVMAENTVKGIPLEMEEYLNAEALPKMINLDAKAFSEMINLEVLKINHVNFPNGLNYLSNKLRFIFWEGYPLKSLPTSFEPYKLVELHMRYSLIEKLWEGIKSLNKLKLIELSFSENLIETPDFSEVPNLEQLILQRCIRLSKIHESLGNLKQLTRLDLSGCIGLKSLLRKINLKSLEVLILSGCSRLKKFPDVWENMSCLSELYLDKTAIEELPLSVQHLPGLTVLDISRSAIKVLPLLPKSLEVLNLDGCEGLLHTSSPYRMRMLNRALSGLCSLTSLDLSRCGLLAIPNALGCLPSLESLDLSENNFVGLPKSIVLLPNLEELYLGGCKELRSSPELPLKMRSIFAKGCTSLETLALRTRENFCPHFDLRNSIKLKNKGFLMAILRVYVQAHPHWDYPSEKSRNWYPPLLRFAGREIPKRFSHQCEGNSLNLAVPSDLLINNICKGVFVCAVHVPTTDCAVTKWKITVNGRNFYEANMVVDEEINTESNVLMRYFPSFKFEDFWKSNNKPSELLINFSCLALLDVVVKNCGAHLAYDENIEFVDQTKARYSSCIITPYEDDLDNSTKGTRIKRSCGDHDANEAGLREEGNSNDVDLPHPKSIRSDDYDGDGAGPSGEATSNDIDVPNPNSVQLPNLIQRLMLRLGNWIGSLCAQRQGDSDCEEEEFQ